jgi:tetratricopeptide (TPR) repeat protein
MAASLRLQSLSALLLLCCSLYLHIIVGYHIDPSDFFLGAQNRPKLEIVSPENGEVLDDNELKIKIKLGGYEVPSPFHDSKVCIGLSNGNTVAEGCFDQTPDLVFHANGLSPGQQYSLQVSFYERGKVIAVSVRNFRVAGIRGLVDGSDEPVTIMTAVQLALQYQTRSMMERAEEIYRSILLEYPDHANALHLMGVILYQKGDPLAAIPYIQRAMLGNKTDETFYNTLGEIYRDVGRVDEAIEQYKAALAINPLMPGAIYNIGRAYQEKRRWDDAITQYRKVQELVKHDADLLAKNHFMQTMRENAMIRECDLLQASRRIIQAAECWKKCLNAYPENQYVYNELGNLLGQNGQYEDAYELYRLAISKGSIVAELNSAHMLEQLGYFAEAVAAYDDAISNAMARGLPQFHIQVRRAMVLPRILPASPWFVADLRRNLEANLDMLLLTDRSNIVVDNSPPLYFGFSLGYYLAFHGTEGGSSGVSNVGASSSADNNNLVLKSKLYRVYARMCPALLQGFFMDKTSDQLGTEDTSLTLGYEEDEAEQTAANEEVEEDEEEEPLPSDMGPTALSMEAPVDDTIKERDAVADNEAEMDPSGTASAAVNATAEVMPTTVDNVKIPVNPAVPDTPSKSTNRRPTNYRDTVERSSTFDLSPKPGGSVLSAASLVSGTAVSSSGSVNANLYDINSRSTVSASAASQHYTSTAQKEEMGTASTDKFPVTHSASSQSPWAKAIPHHVDKVSGKPLIRIGFVSRYFQVGRRKPLFVYCIARCM